MKCTRLNSWYEGKQEVVAGGQKNIEAQPHIPRMAEGYLRTWNASVPLWDVHMPGECTHYCSPTAYHIWLFLLNRELAESRLGTRVPAPRLVAAADSAAAAAAAA